MFIGIRSAGTPSFSRTYSLMRWLAWCARNQSIWSIVILASLHSSRAHSGSLVTANLKSSLPSIRGTWACSSNMFAFQYGRVRKPPPGT
jgi:hypothetical protein